MEIRISAGLRFSSLISVLFNLSTYLFMTYLNILSAVQNM
jgi:hypothetical protein